MAGKDHSGVLSMARQFLDMGFETKATRGTQGYLAASGIRSEPILKLHEGRHNIDKAIKNG